jgi:chitin disaccharide deacetylase
MFFINADDLGCTKEITDRILVCYNKKRIHSASAMTFMIDSERAADLARADQLPTGLHLNLDQDLTAAAIPAQLGNHHQAVSDYLRARKWNQVIYNPFLRNSFDYVFQAQWDEFCRLYGEAPQRLDGHHHMHLCMNLLVSGKIPKGIRVRHNFTFYPGEKSPINRLYRYLIDRWLQKRFICTDSFFSMQPINQEKLQRLIELAKSSDVEIMVHPGWENDYVFLMSSEWVNFIYKHGTCI